MKRIPDLTGRFPERLFFENYELDNRAEQIITAFMIKQHGKLIFPIETDDLIKLIERDTDDLDSYADLTVEGKGVQGVTDFFPGKKPKVRIDALLWEDSTHHRLRTTLTHEYGHVDLHTPLFGTKALLARDRFPSCCEAQKCHRDNIMSAHKGGDWLEWQAGYMSGALLMPASHVCAMIDQISEKTGNYNSAFVDTRYGNALINTVADVYNVSKDAARIRLIQLGRLVPAQNMVEAIV